MSMEPGNVYGKRYTLDSRIAVGGMGEVWRATDQVLGRTVAIKLLSPGLAEQAGFAERFREEARHTALLGHPNIAAVYDYGQDDGASWLVMECVEGEPLSSIIREEGAQSPRRTAMIIGQCADALQAAHEAGVIHRDVKPANILVRPDGMVKLTDFGIARAKDAAPMTRTGEVMGTAQYISPEQAMGKTLSGSSDIYSLGCVAFELLTGERPFEEGSAVATAMAHVHKPPPPLPPTVPAAMAAVVASCMAKDPEQRPASAKAVAAAMKGGPAAAAAAVPASFDTTKVLPERAVGTQQLTAPTGYAQEPVRRAAPVSRTPRREPVAIEEQEERRGTSPWLITGFGVLGVVALVAVLLMSGIFDSKEKSKPSASSAGPTMSASSGSSSSTTSESSSKSSSAAPPPSSAAPSVGQINPDIYLKKDAQQVQQALQARGFTSVSFENVDSAQPKGTVVEISPYGSVPLSQLITIKVSNGPAPTPTPADPTPILPTSPSKTPGGFGNIRVPGFDDHL
ncbi:Serine/threonine-protein kinase PknD [Austwickia sp. TVS 96-490-7B]|uniref:serine/threonine-protein kinase n=1 Tax=Austwickia sp. TVS 96-490-7B TaxID=2830843 RepID=UPI001C59B3C5|nr:serine/threonine-protein kinase [Austwickia sp. TVS 96-490-7B]MBW3084220.1 Serine/threonine-protein kinase PknD [Austwickia sp. TVS 96-490-7B]